MGARWKRHMLEIGRMVDEACCRRGGVAGAEPPHKGGPNRPHPTTAVVSGQWLVASGRLWGFGVDWVWGGWGKAHGGT